MEETWYATESSSSAWRDCLQQHVKLVSRCRPTDKLQSRTPSSTFSSMFLFPSMLLPFNHLHTKVLTIFLGKWLKASIVFSSSSIFLQTPFALSSVHTMPCHEVFQLLQHICKAWDSLRQWKKGKETHIHTNTDPKPKETKKIGKQQLTNKLNPTEIWPQNGRTPALLCLPAAILLQHETAKPEPLQPRRQAPETCSDTTVLVQGPPTCINQSRSAVKIIAFLLGCAGR